jgi:uncharacterized OsmC-like protein
VGVAHRGQIPLRDVSVELEIRPKQTDGEEQIGVHEKVILKGPLEQAHRERLERTMDYCPVGQLFGRGIVSIEDTIDDLTEPAVMPALNSPVCSSKSLGFLPGTIRACYLPETKVWKDISGKPVLEHEGEVKLYFSCASPSGPRRWVMLSGHTLSWNPIPMHLAVGGLAASTVMTLRQSLPPRQWDHGRLQVEIKMERSSGGRQNAQAAAADGVVRKYHLLRRIILSELRTGITAKAIHAALEQDPVSRYFRDGNILLDKEIVVSEPI